MNERTPRRADGARTSKPARGKGRSDRGSSRARDEHEERPARGRTSDRSRTGDRSRTSDRSRSTAGGRASDRTRSGGRRRSDEDETGHAGRGTRSTGAGGGRRSSSSDGRRSGGARGRTGDGGRKKRTSRNTDERNPTRSGIDYPSTKYRRKGEAPVEEPAPRSSLRRVSGKQAASEQPPRQRRATKAKAKPAPKGPPRRRRVKTTEASDELARLAGRNARRAQEQLARAAEAFAAGRERDAMRLLRPLRDAYPDASAVRELMGLCHYRIGQYAAAAKELDAFVQLTDAVEQHPVLMDCARAQGKYRRVDELWDELATASPSSALVTEGRIVLAGSQADRGRLQEAIATLARRAAIPARVQDQHLRLWYALADLYERAGDLPHARELFLRVRKYDASFADVAERLAVLR